MASANGKGKMRAGSAGEPMIDFYRAIVFPNRVREQRQRHGFAKLLRLSAGIPEIPYIRLSKIERGEVVARPDELRRIAAALGYKSPANLARALQRWGCDELAGRITPSREGR